MYLKDLAGGGDDDEVDCFLPNRKREEVVAATWDDPTKPSALFRKYVKITPKCLWSRSMNTALFVTDELLLFAPAYSKLDSARRTCS